MTWELKKVSPERVTPELIYDITRRHHLVPESVEVALHTFHALGQNSMVCQVSSEGEEVATVIVSGLVPGASAEIDFIPKTKYFRFDTYKRNLRKAMSPLWTMLFGEMEVRRVTSYAARSRSRTRRALKACGFKQEGLLREAAHLKNKEPEDLFVMGLLRSEVPED